VRGDVVEVVRGETRVGERDLHRARGPVAPKDPGRRDVVVASQAAP
jgi:hypothetical protein